MSKADFAFAAEVHTLVGQCLLQGKEYADAAEAFVFVPTRLGEHELADDATAGATESYFRTLAIKFILECAVFLFNDFYLTHCCQRKSKKQE